MLISSFKYNTLINNGVINRNNIGSYFDEIDKCLPFGCISPWEIHLVNNFPDVKKENLCIAQYRNTKDSNRDNLDVSKFPFVKRYNESNLLSYLMNMKKAKYCLSPWGDTPDCYRHWEAMYVGCIPITIKHDKLEKFYDLPILFLDSWDELSEDFLISKYDETINKDRTKLDLNYWIDKVSTWTN